MKYSNEIMLLANLPRPICPSGKQRGGQWFQLPTLTLGHLQQHELQHLGCTSYVPSSLAACRPGKSSVQTENVFWGRSKIYVKNDWMVVWITSSIVTRLQFGTFRLHSSHDGAAIDSFRQHLKCIPAEFFSYWIRFRQHSRCIRGAFRLIRNTLRTFGQDSKWLAISILPRMRSECVECCKNI